MCNQTFKIALVLFSPKNPVTVAFFVTNQIEALGWVTRVEVTALVHPFGAQQASSDGEASVRT